MFGEIDDFLLGALFNLLIAVVIVRFIYHPATRDKRYVLSFITFNSVIYFVLRMLTSVELSIGVGFGLFAIFSVLRYRSDEMPIREMTYLFTVIALPVINSFMVIGENIAHIVIANGFIIALLFVLEKAWGFKFEANKRITYEVIDNITPDNHELLMADLRKRTGLPITRVEVGRIDFLRDTADVKIFYDDTKSLREDSLPQAEPGGAISSFPTREPGR